jgi:hypothetical protein
VDGASFKFTTDVNRLNTSLNVLPVTDGNVDAALGRLCLNINLRRLNCSRRATSSLNMPR